MKTTLYIICLLIIGAFGACGQVAWANGQANRLGEYGFELAIVVSLFLAWLESRSNKRPRSKANGK